MGDFSQESKKAIDFIADYYSNIENYPVLSQVKPGYLKSQLPDSAPNSPEPLEDILKDIDASIIPGLTHWQSPNFYAYFQVNTSTAGFLGEMLCSGFNVVNFGWITSPAATELETLIMDWEGHNVGASASIYDIKSGLVPLYLCGTVGTTACVAVDPIEKLGKVARKYKLWFHIDAAYAGSACICPEFRHYLNGVELADSFSMNAHKWFLTNIVACGNAASESLDVIDYKDWQIALSRRFRALKLWIVIRRHGLATLRFHIRSDVTLACYLESLVARDSRFELVVPRKFSLVCFRLKAGRKNNKDDKSLNQKLNKKLLQEVNESGNAYMIHSVIGGVYFIRCAVGSTLTEERHVAGLWKLIQEKATK
ncbi:hypothetical protein Tsubulata_024065, partial [Turnera subulata]